MEVTDYILKRTSRLTPKAEVTDPTYSAFNDGSVEVEVAEFLYSLVRLTKPHFVLETGTHLGISALYMALGMERNGRGEIETYEILPELQVKAIALWQDVGMTHRIGAHLLSSLQAEGGRPIDLLFLDSEPQLRFDEFLRFWPDLVPGGLILIHDLDRRFGHHGQVHHGTYDWPYGDFRLKLGELIGNLELQFITPPSPRGLTVFQKVDASFEGVNYLRSA